MRVGLAISRNCGEIDWIVGHKVSASIEHLEEIMNEPALKYFLEEKEKTLLLMAQKIKLQDLKIKQYISEARVSSFKILKGRILLFTQMVVTSFRK